MKYIVFFTYLLLSVISVTTTAATDIQSLENISQELVKIRQQIETLHNEISFKKDSYKDEMRSYSSQKSDLNVRISRSELNIKDLKRELKKVSDENKETNRDQKKILPILKVAIDQFREGISRSLPFKLKQRLQVLDELETRLDTNIISPNKAANQLWAFVEDELMLGKSNGIYNDTIKIGGRDKLVKVLRIGKLAMFYKTQNGNYGVIKRVGREWKQQEITNTEDSIRLANLFDSFTKNIRNGQFTLPNFLPKS